MSLQVLCLSYSFQYSRRCSNKVHHSCFRPIILGISKGDQKLLKNFDSSNSRLMRNNGRSTGCGHNLPAWDLVLSHEVYRQLRAIHNTLVVDIGTRKIRLGRYP